MSHKEVSRLLAPLVGALCVVLGGCGSPKEREARHLERGERYLAANNLEKARVEFRNALQNVPTDATARYQNGVVEERLERFVEAAGFYRTAIEADPNHVPARIALAKLTLLGGYPQQALEIEKAVVRTQQRIINDHACMIVKRAPALVAEDVTERHGMGEELGKGVAEPRIWDF